jgi:hypothetical protein
MYTVSKSDNLIYIVTKTKTAKQENGFAVSSIVLATLDSVKAATFVSDNNRTDSDHLYMLSEKQIV